MAKPQTRSETALQSAVMRFGDDAFRICYMHTKSDKETLTLLSDVFMQYFLDTQTFKSEGEERPLGACAQRTRHAWTIMHRKFEKS